MLVITEGRPDSFIKARMLDAPTVELLSSLIGARNDSAEESRERGQRKK